MGVVWSSLGVWVIGGSPRLWGTPGTTNPPTHTQRKYLRIHILEDSYFGVRTSGELVPWWLRIFTVIALPRNYIKHSGLFFFFCTSVCSPRISSCSWHQPGVSGSETQEVSRWSEGAWGCAQVSLRQPVCGIAHVPFYVHDAQNSGTIP